MAMEHESIRHSGIDSLHGASFAVKALPFRLEGGSDGVLAKIVNIHFRAHHL